ncbi:MAG: hypothetical protein M3Q29_22245 [Chloroflexota bacterium]|nr:hypothetical protein [Chloroflexota bacterium]
MGPFPCVDENRRYRSFPCSQCKAEKCVFGKKPAAKAQITLAAGQKACEVCGTAYQAYGKSKYCSDECRRKAIAKQRRKRRSKISDMIY